MTTRKTERKLQIDGAFSEAGHRFAWWARSAQPMHTSKWLQSELQISEAKADRALAGKVSKDILERALRKWKWAVAAVVLEPSGFTFATKKIAPDTYRIWRIA